MDCFASPEIISFSQDEDEDRKTITSVTFMLKNDLLAAGKDLYVYADVVTIDEALSLPGHDLVIMYTGWGPPRSATRSRFPGLIQSNRFVLWDMYPCIPLHEPTATCVTSNRWV